MAFKVGDHVLFAPNNMPAWISEVRSPEEIKIEGEGRMGVYLVHPDDLVLIPETGE